MTKASDNLFPSILLDEADPPSAPSAGSQRLYLNASNLNVINSAGTIRVVGGGASGDVATDAIWDAAGDLAIGSGANTAARLAIGAAGGYLSVINSAVAWNSGTSFPGSKATGDRYWRTDLGLEFYWDGTRWLSTTRFVSHGGPGDVGQNTTTAGVFVRGNFLGTSQEVYVETIHLSVYVAATNNGSNYWTFQARKSDLGAGTYTNLGSTVDTSADSAAVMLAKSITINAVYTAASYGLWDISCSKTSAPGALRHTASIAYRLVAT